MITCRSNVREGGDDRFYVTVGGAEGGMNPFYTMKVDGIDPILHIAPDIEEAKQRRAFTETWIAENCANPAEIYGNASVAFESEDDAILFWMTFRS